MSLLTTTHYVVATVVAVGSFVAQLAYRRWAQR